jgi:hypothetical protein
MSKFKYPIFPDRIYTVTLMGSDGRPIPVDVSGEDIIGQLRISYALEKSIGDLDKEKNEG